MNTARRKYTIKVTTNAVSNRPLVPPSVTYYGRYWTRWFIANAAARRTLLMLPPGYKSTAEVVPITDEIDKELGQ